MPTKNLIVPKGCQQVAEIIDYVQEKSSLGKNHLIYFDLRHTNLSYADYCKLIRQFHENEGVDFLVPLRKTVDVVFPKPNSTPRVAKVYDLTGVPDSPVISPQEEESKAKAKKGSTEDKKNIKTKDKAKKGSTEGKKNIKTNEKAKKGSSKSKPTFLSKPNKLTGFLPFLLDNDDDQTLTTKSTNKRASIESNASALSAAPIVDEDLEDEFQETQPDPYGLKDELN